MKRIEHGPGPIKSLINNIFKEDPPGMPPGHTAKILMPNGKVVTPSEIGIECEPSMRSIQQAAHSVGGKVIGVDTDITPGLLSRIARTLFTNNDKSPSKDAREGKATKDLFEKVSKESAAPDARMAKDAPAPEQDEHSPDNPPRTIFTHERHGEAKGSHREELEPGQQPTVTDTPNSPEPKEESHEPRPEMQREDPVPADVFVPRQQPSGTDAPAPQEETGPQQEPEHPESPESRPQATKEEPTEIVPEPSEEPAQESHAPEPAREPVQEPPKDLDSQGDDAAKAFRDRETNGNDHGRTELPEPPRQEPPASDPTPSTSNAPDVTGPADLVPALD